jgi:hypothetical protein
VRRCSTHNPCYTDSVSKNLTITLDEQLLRDARKIAIDRNTSVNRLIRDFLVRLVREKGRQRAALADVDEIFRTTRVRIGGRSWTREELHER